MVEIIYTEQSISDMNDIAAYIAIDSKHYAALQIEKFFNRIDLLVTFPLMGRVVPEQSAKSVRELIEGNYRIIYKVVNKNTIHILTFHHSRKLLKSAGLTRIIRRQT